jgi:hypothetical protein
MQKEPGWTEMFLPLQALEMGKIQIEEPKASKGPGVPQYAADRPIAALSYRSTIFTMPCLSILTTFLKVHNWDSITGRLDLETDIDSLTANKYNALQETIFNFLQNNPQWFINTGIKKFEELKSNFQPIISGNIISIYLHGHNPERKQTGRVWIWRTGTWQKGASVSSFKKGQQIRVAIRFQGICFLPTNNGKTRFRLQHQIVAIFHKQDSATILMN